MLIALLLALALTSTSVGAHARAEPSDADPSSEQQQANVLRPMDAVHTARVASRFDDALGSAPSAIYADPSNAGTDLTTQSMANAALAIGSTVPSLRGGGIGLMLRPAPE